MSSARTLDLLVVGGGAAGAAALREAARHGLEAALCERDDFAGGTTGRSSRLIHGGLRYLEHGHVRLVIESLHERHVLLRIAPHLVEPLAIHIPVYRHYRRSGWKVRCGLWLYDRLAGGRRLGASRTLAGDEIETRLPGLERRELSSVGVLWDARVWSPERLVIETLIDAERMGGLAVNRAELVALRRLDDLFVAVLHDRFADCEFEVRARTVINASGPWVGDVDRRSGAARPAVVQWSRGSHLLFRRFSGGPEHAILGEAPTDGRPFFVLPWGDYTLVGTTEEPHTDTPGNAQATAGEVEYLSHAFAAIWPAATPEAPYASYAGVRPLPIGRRPAAADRRHHVAVHGPGGLVSIVGGKLTTHRLAAAEAVARVLAQLGTRVDSNTLRVLPGAQCEAPALEPEALARRAGLTMARARSLLRRWGCRAWAVTASLVRSDPIEGLAGLSPSEIVFALDHEGAADLSDVLLRRTDVGLAPGLTRSGLLEAARIWSWATGARRDQGMAATSDPQTSDRSAQAPWHATDDEGMAAAIASDVIAGLERVYGRKLE